MNKRILAVLSVVLLLSGTVFGQTAQIITLEDAIRIALENNFSLKQAQNNLGLSDQRLKSEYGDFLPSLNANFGAQSQIGRQFNQNTGEFGDFSINGLSGNLSANITIFNGFANIYSLRQTEQQQLSQEENLQRAEEVIIFQTASAYLRVLLDQELLEIAKENLETSIQQTEQVKVQVEVGSRPAVDLFENEATLASNELTLRRNENTLALSRLALIRQLQIDPLADYEFAKPDIDESDLSVVYDLSLKELVNTALKNRSDLMSAEANIKALNYNIKSTNSLILPTISANASIGSSYNDQTSQFVRDENGNIIDINGNPILDPTNPNGQIPQSEKVKFNDQFFDQNTSKAFSINLSIPIFNRLNSSTSIQASRVEFKNAELALEDTKLNIIQEVTQAYTDYTSFIKQYEASKKTELFREKAFETQQERYNVGASTLIELSQAQANYVSAKSESTQALYNLIFQEKLLDFYLGKLSGDTIEF